MFVGDGPYESELKFYFQNDDVLFAGKKEGQELSEIFASCDIFIMPSETETLGFVVLEALASGLLYFYITCLTCLGVPVVAIGANGILDIIDHGRTGLLAYPPHDTVQQLIDNVRLLVNDPLLRQNMSLQGREWAEQWNWKSATQKLRTSQYRAAISLHQIRQSQTIDHAHSPSDSLNSIGGLISFFHKFFLVHLLKYFPNENILTGEMEIMRKYSV